MGYSAEIFCWKRNNFWKIVCGQMASKFSLFFLQILDQESLFLQLLNLFFCLSNFRNFLRKFYFRNCWSKMKKYNYFLEQSMKLRFEELFWNQDGNLPFDYFDYYFLIGFDLSGIKFLPVFLSYVEIPKTIINQLNFGSGHQIFQKRKGRLHLEFLKPLTT